MNLPEVTPARVALVGGALANTVTVLSGLELALQILLVSAFTVLSSVFMICYAYFKTHTKVVEQQVNATK